MFECIYVFATVILLLALKGVIGYVTPMKGMEAYYGSTISFG